MMMSEFVARTGFTPTYEEYQGIEEAYYNFDGDKDAFCKAFAHSDGEKQIYKNRAERIEQLKGQLVEADKMFHETVAKYDQKIEKLEKQLDAELEWKPCDGGTNMEQERYLELLRYGKRMTPDEAKQLLADECGFNPDRILIHTEASTYEANKHHQMRKSATYIREPVYESTDWNYVRFDCGNFMYEFINGDIRFYCC